MFDLCDRCTNHLLLSDLIVLSLERNCRIVRYPEESCFTLWCMSQEKRMLLRRAILESATEIVSFPGADAIPCLFGSGDKEKVVKSGMRFIPPWWFHEKQEWKRHAREGLCYPAYFMVAMRGSQRTSV
jgi:hypothetical protein